MQINLLSTRRTLGHALCLALTLITVMTPLTQAQDSAKLESELKALQVKQQQELMEMQKKIATQKAKPGDPQYLQKKVVELDTSDRLGVEGQPVPLDSAGQGDIPAEPSGPLQPGQGQQRPGFTQGGNSSNQRVDVGADPLRVPLDERDVVQEYFQP